MRSAKDAIRNTALLVLMSHVMIRGRERDSCPTAALVIAPRIPNETRAIVAGVSVQEGSQEPEVFVYAAMVPNTTANINNAAISHPKLELLIAWQCFNDHIKIELLQGRGPVFHDPRPQLLRNAHQSSDLEPLQWKCVKTGAPAPLREQRTQTYPPGSPTGLAHNV